MPSYYRSSPRRPSSEPRPQAKQHRFNLTSPPVLGALVGSQRRRVAAAPTRVPLRARTRRWIGAFSSRAWNWSHAGAGLLVALALAGLLYGFISLDFYIYNADIAEARYTTATDIYQQAGIYKFNVFYIDPVAVAARVAQLPHVRSASVQVRLPNRVSIRVIEREPAILYQVQAQSRWVDDEGVISPAADERQGLIKLIDDAATTQIDNRHLDPSVLQAIQRISHDLPQVNTFRYQAPYGLFFFSPEGWRVYLGDADRMDAKLSAWQAIRTQILQNQATATSPVEEVDLRFQRAYWR